MQNFDVVIIGGGYAGIMCALRLSGRVKGKQSIALVNPCGNFVERLRLHESLVVKAKYPMRSFDLRTVLEANKVTFFEGKAESFSSKDQTVSIKIGSQGPIGLHYGKLVIASGSLSATATVTGQNEHCFTLDQTGQMGSAQLGEMLERTNAPAVTIIGGGASGIEVAAEIARKSGAKITLICKGAFGETLRSGVAKRVRSTLVRAGVVIREHQQVKAVHSGQTDLADGPLAHDICVACTGLEVEEIWSNEGLQTERNGRVRVDKYLRASLDGTIFAAGDAAIATLKKSAPTRMSVLFALSSGAYVADAIADELAGKARRRFAFWTYGQAIGLGPYAVGFGNMRYDTAYPPYFTGRAGYHMRNFFVAVLFRLLMLERRWPGFPFYMGHPFLRDGPKPKKGRLE